jgi:hypothetical protein
MDSERTHFQEQIIFLPFFSLVVLMLSSHLQHVRINTNTPATKPLVLSDKSQPLSLCLETEPNLANNLLSIEPPPLQAEVALPVPVIHQPSVPMASPLIAAIVFQPNVVLSIVAHCHWLHRSRRDRCQLHRSRRDHL